MNTPHTQHTYTMDHKVNQLKHLAATTTHRTTLRNNITTHHAITLNTLPTLPTSIPKGGGWRNEDIEAALRETKMHVGQALLVLQDPAYRPGSVRANLKGQRRLHSSPRASRKQQRAPSGPRASSARSNRAPQPPPQGVPRPLPTAPRPGQLLRVAGRVQSRSNRATALRAAPPLRHLPRYPIPVPVHDAVASGDWASTSKWLRDREATVALGHPPLLTSPGDIHVQHPHLVGNDLRGDHYDPGTGEPPRPVAVASPLPPPAPPAAADSAVDGVPRADSLPRRQHSPARRVGRARCGGVPAGRCLPPHAPRLPRRGGAPQQAGKAARARRVRAGGAAAHATGAVCGLL